MRLLFLFPVVFGQSYITETKIKLLTADLFGALYPASDSEYRTSSTGRDEEVSLSTLEEANGMPEQELVLLPGGKAVYLLPFEQKFLFLMVKPGKKEGGSGSPFADKANITLTATAPDRDVGVNITCGRPSQVRRFNYYLSLD